MGRMMAFIVVVVCTAQVVLLRAQETSPTTIPTTTPETAPGAANPRFAFHKIDDGYLRLDLRSGEVATCRPQPNGWTCTLAADERTALENEVARLQRDNALLKNALLERGLPLPAPPNDAAASTPGAPVDKAIPPVAAAPPTEGAPPRPPAPIPPQADAREPAQIERIMTTLERLWHRVVELAAAIQHDLQGKD